MEAGEHNKETWEATRMSPTKENAEELKTELIF
jgi:hypothetical protein